MQNIYQQQVEGLWHIVHHQGFLPKVQEIFLSCTQDLNVNIM